MGMKSPKEISKAVMIGVVRSWTRSSSGPPVGTVVFRPDVLEGSEVGSEGDGGSWRLVKDGEDEVPVRIMSSGEGLRLESIEGISSPFVAFIRTTAFPSTLWKPSTTFAPQIWAHSPTALSNSRLFGRRR